MSTFVLVPGAGGNASYWDELVPPLQVLGHDAIAVDIAEDDPNLGLPEYAEIVRAAIGDRRDVVLVAQSLGGFTAPMVSRRAPVRMIVLLNAMIPLPGERPGDWWDATGSGEARRAAAEAGGYDSEFDVDTYFLHDLPVDVRERLVAQPPPREPAETPFGQPCDFDRWPDVPIKVVVGRDDRRVPAPNRRRATGG